MGDVQRFSRSRDGTRQLSPNFRVSEFVSRCGTDEVLISMLLISVLQNIRNWTGSPVTINSGYRSPAHNRAIGGATNSLHVQGTAADITVRGVSPTDVARWAETALRQAGIAGGICVYPTFTHIDVRPNRWRAQQHRAGGPLVNNNGWSPMPIPHNSGSQQPPPPAQSQPMIRRGSTNREAVRLAQSRLNIHGASPRLVEDGIFGPLTDAATREFQRRNKLVVDGIIGPITWSALNR